MWDLVDIFGVNEWIWLGNEWMDKSWWMDELLK